MILERARECGLQLLVKHYLHPTWGLRFEEIDEVGDWLAYYMADNPTDLYIAVDIDFIERNTKTTFMDIMRHEITHCIDHQIRGYSNHDKFFRLICKKIGCTGTANIPGIK